MLETLQKGGWFMVPIGICLLLTIAVAIERLVNLRSARYLDEDLLDKIRNCLSLGQFDGALQVCRSKNIMFNRLMETVVAYRALNTVDLRQLMEDQSKQESAVLDRFLSVLRTVGTIAPLLGLLGTVAGMIKVFQTLSAVGLSQAGNLSVGISEALITTAAGMIVAIPAIILHNYFEGRASIIFLKMEKRIIELVLLLRSHHAVPPAT